MIDTPVERAIIGTILLVLGIAGFVVCYRFWKPSPRDDSVEDQMRTGMLVGAGLCIFAALVLLAELCST